MYGEVDSDPVVAYYDLAFGLTGESERRFYVDLMNRCGGPILDLAGGTGRFTVAAATEGYPVTYVDASPGMCRQLDAKLKALPMGSRSLVRTEKATMWEFDTDVTYSLVVCVDAFFHLLTTVQARAALGRVRTTLRPNGLFAFNLHYTSPRFLCFAASPEGSQWNPSGSRATTTAVSSSTCSNCVGWTSLRSRARMTAGRSPRGVNSSMSVVGDFRSGCGWRTYDIGVFPASVEWMDLCEATASARKRRLYGLAMKWFWVRTN